MMEQPVHRKNGHIYLNTAGSLISSVLPGLVNSAGNIWSSKIQSDTAKSVAQQNALAEQERSRQAAIAAAAEQTRIQAEQDAKTAQAAATTKLLITGGIVVGGLLVIGIIAFAVFKK